MERKRVDGFDDRNLELDALLHPSRIYEKPSDVVNDPALSLNEKRAILASWASDACSVEAAPALRKNPWGRVVPFDEIMDALQVLDSHARAADPSGRRHKMAQPRSPFGRGAPGQGEQGSPLH
jgi:hypothetical protein